MAAILHIETLLPEHKYSQAEVLEVMNQLIIDRSARKYFAGIYADSDIEHRYSVIDNFLPGAVNSFFTKDQDNSLQEPGTEERNELYTFKSKELLAKLAKKLRKNCEKISLAEITHVITVSCTGFYNPGPDLDLMKALDLPPTTERYHLGFMGCYAAFPALKMAQQFCEAREEANVLVVCLELCTLHFQLKHDLDTIIANSIFADGVAAAIVSNKQVEDRTLKLESFSSTYLPEGEKDMAWTIGNNGFNMTLSKYVSRIIEANIDKITDSIIFKKAAVTHKIDTWAVHPGGKSILDKVEKALGLESRQIAASRKILKKYGNMSSATILFVLDELMSQKPSKAQTVAAVAFGPGLVVESALLTLN